MPAAAKLAERPPELLAQDRVEADGRLVEDEQVGLAEQRCRQRDARALAAGEAADHLVDVYAEAHGRNRLLDPRARRAEHAGEELEVLAHAEIAVDGRSLGDVADPAAQPLGARRRAQDLDLARLDDLHADYRPHQGRLAATAGAEQPGDLAAPH